MSWRLTYSDQCLSRSGSRSSDNADQNGWLAIHASGFTFVLLSEPVAIMVKVVKSSMISDMLLAFKGNIEPFTFDLFNVGRA